MFTIRHVSSVFLYQLWGCCVTAWFGFARCHSRYRKVWRVRRSRRSFRVGFNVMVCKHVVTECDISGSWGDCIKKCRWLVSGGRCGCNCRSVFNWAWSCGDRERVGRWYIETLLLRLWGCSQVCRSWKGETFPGLLSSSSARWNLKMKRIKRNVIFTNLQLCGAKCFKKFQCLLPDSCSLESSAAARGGWWSSRDCSASCSDWHGCQRTKERDSVRMETTWSELGRTFLSHLDDENHISQVHWLLGLIHWWRERAAGGLRKTIMFLLN